MTTHTPTPTTKTDRLPSIPSPTSKRLWNLSQDLLYIAGQRPRDCWDRQCDAGQTFECDICKRLMPYCRGAEDTMPESCDYCWSEYSDLVDEGAYDPTT